MAETVPVLLSGRLQPQGWNQHEGLNRVLWCCEGSVQRPSRMQRPALGWGWQLIWARTMGWVRPQMMPGHTLSGCLRRTALGLRISFPSSPRVDLSEQGPLVVFPFKRKAVFAHWPPVTITTPIPAVLQDSGLFVALVLHLLFSLPRLL